MNDFNNIVSIYRHFQKYNHLNYKQIVDIILPSYNLGQYQIHKDKKEIIGFTNWAFLNDLVEQRFKSTGMLKATQWNCGNNLWHIDTLAKRNLKQIIAWTKNHFTNLYGYNKPIKWLRVRDEKIIKHQVRITKPSWNNFIKDNG
jgi:hemolysin-activating ACP:hemolysin acyltransferase